MKKFAAIIAILAFAVWPLNYFSNNQNINLAPKTVFESDYQGRQLILRNINLYPNVMMARFFQNKALVVSNKYVSNFFDLIDPNYYFFGSHPREIVSGQNYTRLPLFAIFPILWFLFKSKTKHKKTFLGLLTVTVLLLSFFTNHYVYDVFLWVFFLPMIYLGLSEAFKTHRVGGITLLFFLLIETLYEITLVSR